MLNDYKQIINGVTRTPWLILPESLDMILSIVNMRLSGEAFSDEEIRIRLEAANAENGRGNPRIQVGGGVGVVPLYGPIFSKANLMTELSGATSLETFTSDLRELLLNDEVQQIVVEFDTPGGTSDMVAETGQLIKEATKTKPIYGMANTTAGSAGLWLLSQTSKAYSTPSGRVGSLGAYTAHEDRSRQNENEGRKITYVYAGKYKTSGNPDEPLSDDARAYMQETIDELNEQFVEVVAEGRGKTVEYVDEHFGQGRMLSAKKAHEVGMIDGVMSMNDLLSNLVETNYKQTATSARGDLAHSINKMRTLYGTSSNLSVQPADSVLSRGDMVAPGNLRVESVGQEHSNVGEEERIDGRNDEDAALMPDARRDTSNVDDLEVRMREVLGLGEDADIIQHVTALQAEIQPFRDAEKAVAEKKSFAQMFPDQAARLAELDARDKESAAREFAHSFLSLTDSEGRPMHKGYSAVVVNKIEEMHKAFALGTANLSDFSELVTLIAQTGTVDLQERGSSREPENFTQSADPGAAFVSKFKEIMEADGLDRATAISVATERHPELFEAYRNSLPGVRR
jgi:signal peptide peptidase SppA